MSVEIYQKERVILRGIASYFVETYKAMTTCYDIVGISDANEQRGKEVAESLNTRFIPVQEVVHTTFDILYVCTSKQTYNDIFRDCIYKQKLNRNKIRHVSEFHKELFFS